MASFIQEHRKNTLVKQMIEELEQALRNIYGKYSHAIEEFRREIEREWPEIGKLIVKIKHNKSLDKADEEWLRELSEVTGWNVEDIKEDLKNIDADPSERVEHYRMLFEKYLKEATEYKEKSNTQQAAEKLWGAITVLVKLYAARKGIPIMQWSHRKIEEFVRNNVEKELRPLFVDLLDKGDALHKHFYEGHMTSETFEIRWNQALKLIEEIRKRLQILKILH